MADQNQSKPRRTNRRKSSPEEIIGTVQAVIMAVVSLYHVIKPLIKKFRKNKTTGQ